MNKVYERTENGTTTHVSTEAGRSEINHAMMGGKRDVNEMSSLSRTDYAIEYKDGRKVTLKLIDAPADKPAETDSHGRRIVTAKGKRYVVGAIVPAQPRTPGAKSWIPNAYVSYWSERNGEAFGPTRHAGGDDKPGTVGRAVWDAISA